MEDDVERGANLSVVPEDRDGDIAAAMRRTRGFRVRQTLEGDPSFTLPDTYADLIALLRSGDPIEQELRDAMADALERAELGEAGGVRLRIEADKLFFTRINNAVALEKRLEAALFVAREKNKGKKPFEIRRALESLASKQSVTEYEKAAKKDYRKFQAWLEEHYAEADVFGWRPTNDVHSYERSEAPEETDYFHEALSLYMQATAPAFVPPAND